MIFASFIYEYINTAPLGNTIDTVLIDMDFRSLYQINPDHLVVLGYASVAGQRKDAAGVNVNVANTYACRLIGNFNETFNVPATIVSPIRNGQTVTLFNGITFNDGAPFVAPPDAQILMPASFQVEFDPGGFLQIIVNDSLRVMVTIGYKIVEKNSRF